MKKYYSVLLVTLASLFIPGAMALASLREYGLTVTTGSETDMSKGETIIKAGSVGGTSSVKDIGFNFEFNGVIYSTFSASGHGVLGFGKSTVTSSSDEMLEKSSTYPVIAPFWDNQSTINTGVTYLLTGKPGSQVMTVQWETRPTNATTKAESFKYQVRLYEGLNRVEFYYGNMTQRTVTNARIGGGVSSKDIASLYFGKKGDLRVDYVAAVGVDITINTIPTGTVYIFDPLYCNTTFTGNVAEGGLEGPMSSGATILADKSVQRGTPTGFKPFTLATSSKCVPIRFTFVITGDYASDYVISPSTAALDPGGSVTPTITFAPGCIGARPAVLTAIGDNGSTFQLNLGAVGTSRLNWAGNTASGGVSPLNNGSVLLKGQQVKYGIAKTYTPFTISNTSTNPSAGSVTMTYTLDDPTGQYTLNTKTAVLARGQSSTPVLTFKPNRFGQYKALLTVSGDCETRTFPVEAITIGAGAEFSSGGNVIDEKSDLFVKALECAGEGVSFMEIKVKSVGNDPLYVNGASFFLTDSIYGQGIPRFPLLRDFMGNAMAADDYFVTDGPGMAPAAENAPFQFPIVLMPGESRTFYLNFVAQLPGKRLARAFIGTNALNFTGNNPSGAVTDGLLAVDLFGRGIGSSVSTTIEGKPLEGVSFGPGDLHMPHDTTIRIYNTGSCDLRVSASAFRVVGGDTRDFFIVGGFAQAMKDTEGNYVLAPGDSTDITLRFSPSRGGTRRATIMMRTNDSTLWEPGIERGAFYWNLNGTGKVGLRAIDLTFAPTIIDAAGSSGNKAVVENSSREVKMIVSMEITGPDAAEFTMDPANPWPALPLMFMPGDEVPFHVIHTPAPGSLPGDRSAELMMITSSADTIVVNLHGEALIRTLTASPSAMFEGVTVPVGKSVRQRLMVTNNGSAPLTLGTTTIAGPGAVNYLLGRLPRLTLAPGQTEHLEVTFRPISTGPSAATLVINSNSTTGSVQVTLGGAATMIRPGGTSVQNLTSGVEDLSTTTGSVSLGQSSPNPARETAEIGYRIERDGNVEIRLFDGRGAEIEVLESGYRTAGDHTVRFRVDHLPSGIYMYRLTADGVTLARSMKVVK